MRGRIILAAIFLAAFILLFRLALLAGEFDAIVTAAQFEAARENHTTLRAFLHRMPKGGDLHTHLSGAIYAERFIAWAVQEDSCVDLENVVAVPHVGGASLPTRERMAETAAENALAVLAGREPRSCVNPEVLRG